MKQHIKKEISLNRYFIIFLAHAILSLICALLLWGCLLYAAAFFNLILPANTVEHSVAAWRAALDEHTVITPDTLPAGTSYAFFDSQGNLLQSDLTEKDLETAAELSSPAAQGDMRKKGTSVYIKFPTDSGCAIVAYRLIASFSSPFLQRLFPNAELFFLLLLFFMLIADFIFIAVRYARKLNKELQKLAAVAAQIGQQNLVFDIQKTRLSEFNRILDSLKQLKTDLQRSLKEQWAMEQQKKRQLAALTHDIKAPLSIIAGNAELLSETAQTDKQREYTAFILEHAAQIKRYVAEMMELSAPNRTSDTTVGLHKLLSHAVKNAETLGKEKQLSCCLTVHDLPKPFPVPKDKLQRILDNLIDNAVQYSPKQGTVFLRASYAADMLHLQIQDEGAGFSAEALSLATAEFYRSDKGRSSKEHFGLGLAIVRQIVTELGGTLRLENAVEKGALVTVEIPVRSLSENAI